ncbi:MAG: polynucleotide adenylyltransferase PcnB [Acidobacteriota bacterium]
MTDPVIVPRAEHPLSRQDIDADALKVLYRLHQFNHTAYLVGGSVRDLLLGRRPKDFDIGTSAHPYQIKKLFRNCWIIGRRFRLAHVKFGPKTIEVATFRRHVLPGTELEGALKPDAEPPEGPGTVEAPDGAARHDNTFGTPEEDAFRRDFTINALFYDIGTFAIIDYVGGLQDLKDRVIRSIGDPNVRFPEDPVRMFRAIALASRLDFTLDAEVVDAIERHRHLIASASPARLIEEYYKVLRSGSAAKTFRMLAHHRLLEPVTPELQAGAANTALWDSLEDLDTYRLRYDAAPPSMTNPILLGSLLVPLGLMPTARHAGPEPPDDEAPPPARAGRRRDRPKEPLLKIGALPVARRDTERLRQILSMQRRLADLDQSPRARRALLHRGSFQDAFTWFEIHGHNPPVLEHWKGFIEAAGVPGDGGPADGGAPPDGERRRRRRRGRRRRGGRRFHRPPEQ